MKRHAMNLTAVPHAWTLRIVCGVNQQKVVCLLTRTLLIFRMANARNMCKADQLVQV